MLEAVAFTVRQALWSGFPIGYDRQLAALSATSDGLRSRATEHGVLLSAPQELLAVLDAELAELESLLGEAEKSLADRKRGVAGAD